MNNLTCDSSMLERHPHTVETGLDELVEARELVVAINTCSTAQPVNDQWFESPSQDQDLTAGSLAGPKPLHNLEIIT